MIIKGRCTSMDGTPWVCTCHKGYNGTFCEDKTCTGFEEYCKNGGLYL